MPNILKFTVASALFVTISLGVMTTSRAQIEVLPAGVAYFRSVDVDDTMGKSLMAWMPFALSLSSIKTNLEAAGVSVEQVMVPSPSMPKDSVVPGLRFTLPGAKRQTTLPSQFMPGDGTTVALPVPPPKNLTFEQGFISFGAFLHNMHQSSLPVTLEGWKNPVLTVGDLRLQIGTTERPAYTANIISTLAARIAMQGTSNHSSWQYLGSGPQHAVRVNAPAGSIYAVVSGSIPSPYVNIDVARVSNDGVLYFRAATQVIEFVSRTAAFRQALDRADMYYGMSKNPAKAMLIKFNPDLSGEIVLPARIRSAEIK